MPPSAGSIRRCHNRRPHNVAGRSGTAIDQFEKLARNELKGALPPGLTVGGFLNTTKPGSAPPESFLDFYLGALQLVAEKIIRP